MRVRPTTLLVVASIGLAASIAAAGLYWPSARALVALLISMFVFAPLVLVACIDLTRELKESNARPLLFKRVLLSGPLLLLAFFSLAAGLVLAIGFIAMRFGPNALEAWARIPTSILLVSLFLGVAVGLLRLATGRSPA